jgi:hypothetical protein
VRQLRGALHKFGLHQKKAARWATGIKRKAPRRLFYSLVTQTTPAAQWVNLGVLRAAIILSFIREEARRLTT